MQFTSIVMYLVKVKHLMNQSKNVKIAYFVRKGKVMKTIVFDFDGVIHKYSKGWQDGSIYDEPVPGIKTIIDELRKENYQVVIVSTRCSTEQGITEMTEWLNKYDIEVDRIQKEKPPALIYVDDRAICFDGNTQHLWDSIITFKTQQENKSIKISSIVTIDDECTYKNIEVKNISSLQELDKAIEENKILTIIENGKEYRLNPIYILFYIPQKGISYEKIIN